MEELEVKGWEVEALAEALIDTKLVLGRFCTLELVVAIAALSAMTDGVDGVVAVLETSGEELDDEEAKWEDVDEADLETDDETGLHVPKPGWHPAPQ